MIKEGRGRSSLESGAHPLDWGGALESSWIMLSALYCMAFGVQDLG